jgi:hypothetical protein
MEYVNKFHHFHRTYSFRRAKMGNRTSLIILVGTCSDHDLRMASIRGVLTHCLECVARKQQPIVAIKAVVIQLN